MSPGPGPRVLFHILYYIASSSDACFPASLARHIDANANTDTDIGASSPIPQRTHTHVRRQVRTICTHTRGSNPVQMQMQSSPHLGTAWPGGTKQQYNVHPPAAPLLHRTRSGDVGYGMHRSTMRQGKTRHKAAGMVLIDRAHMCPCSRMSTRPENSKVRPPCACASPGDRGVGSGMYRYCCDVESVQRRPRHEPRSLFRAADTWGGCVRSRQGSRAIQLRSRGGTS